MNQKLIIKTRNNKISDKNNKSFNGGDSNRNEKDNKENDGKWWRYVEIVDAWLSSVVIGGV